MQEPNPVEHPFDQILSAAAGNEWLVVEAFTYIGSNTVSVQWLMRTGVQALNRHR